MKIILVLFFCLQMLLNLESKEIKYCEFEIPDSLKTNAYAIMRDEIIDFEIISLTQTRTVYTRAVTVFNENGRKFGYYNVDYGNNKKVFSIEAKCYNSLGLLVETKTRKDFDDVTLDPFGTAYTDTRILYGKFFNNNYPYTIEYKIVWEEDNTFSLPEWLPVESYNFSVQRSSYHVKYPAGYEFRYLEKNFGDEVSKSENSCEKTWILSNFKAIREESYNPDYLELVPFLKTAPSDFEYENYKGNMSSWENYGHFIHSLLIGRDKLPEPVIDKIHSIADTCKSEIDKVKYLYKFMQSGTRYVSIQVGIGGIQPLSAESVATYGYGDCKALSNYMKAILSVAGVNSYLSLIKAKPFNYSFFPEFVVSQFNHAILCVPLEADTVWLECTSQTMPFGFLGDFTDNRYALLITENGGVLRKTTSYPKERNLVNTNAQVKVLENNVCKTSVKAIFTGLEYDEMHNLVVEDEESQKKILYDGVEIPSFIIDKFSIKATDGPNPVFTENLDLTLNNYYSTTGNRLFIPLNLMNKWTTVPERNGDRKLDIVKKYACIYTDTIQYILPKGYEIEALPARSEINQKFGKYCSEVIICNSIATYVRKLEINSGVYPPAEYDSFVAFFADIRNKDKTMLVLKKISNL